jgi:hypothetical protein
MSVRRSRPFAAVLGAALLASILTACQGTTPDPDPGGTPTDELTERSLVDPTGWWWLIHATVEEIEEKIEEGFRLIDLEVESTSPWRFSAAFVENQGVHAKDWWWYVGDFVTVDFIDDKIAEHGARILDLETFFIDGQQRFAIVLVPYDEDTGQGWWWYVNADDPSHLGDEIDANDARIVDLDTYVIGGTRYYSAVMLGNAGVHHKDWWWYLGATVDFIDDAIDQHGARIVDLERIGPDDYVVVLEANPGGKGWWWWLDGDDAAINAVANEYGARVIDVEASQDGQGAVRYSAVLLDNGEPSVIPVTGEGDAALQPILDAMRDYMRHRCVGAATLGVAFEGKPMGVWGLGRMTGRAADDWDPACGDDFGTPLGDRVQADTPMRIGSISKPVTFAMVRWAIKRVASDLMGIDLTDDQVEDLELFDPNFFPPRIPGMTVSYPVPLIPRELYEIYSGQAPFPVPIPDDAAYGGDTDPEVLCGDLDPAFADPQWQDVTLGHLIGHRSGLRRSAPDSERDVVGNLAILRSLTTVNHFAAQENLLRAEWGNAAVDAARADLGIATLEGFLVPAPTLVEVLTVLAGRCLRYPLGERSYSNTSPAFPTIILQQLMASGRYAAEIGRPSTHVGSAVDVFFRTELGVVTTGNRGVFLSLPAPSPEGFADREPAKRDWDGQSYDWNDWDAKRPHCLWIDPVCDFAPWRNRDPGTINWSWDLEQVPFGHTISGVSPGTGSLAVEVEAFLAFMGKYWVNGGAGTDGADPRIGEERNGDWTRYVWHNGALAGSMAWAIQVGGPNKPASRSLPPIDANGRITDDFANLSPVALSLPDGLDIFVAINQWEGDKKCIESATYACSSAYNMLPAFLFYGASQVDWSLVLPLAR